MTTKSFLSAGSLCAAAALCTLFIAGCDEFDQMADNAAKRPPVMMPPQVVDAPGNQKSVTPKSGDAATTTAPAPDDNAATANPSANTTFEKFEPGVGKQGQGYGGGIITEPIHVYFRTRDLIIINQLKHQLDIWKALHNNKNPKNKDEYMKEIVEPCGVTLPELPTGKYYVYDAKAGELMVQSGGPAQ